MKNKKILSLLLCIFFISGCDLLPKRIETRVETSPPIRCGVQERPDPLKTLPVEFKTVEDEDGTVWIAMDTESYQNVSLNNSMMLSYIRSQNHINDALMECMDSYNKRIKENPEED